VVHGHNAGIFGVIINNGMVPDLALRPRIGKYQRGFAFGYYLHHLRQQLYTDMPRPE
jgi:hypothetical protein